MEKELSQKVIEWVEGLKDLAVAEIPPFVQEVANYGFYENLIDIGLFIPVFIVGLFFVIGGLKASIEDEYGTAHVLFIMIGAVMLLVSFIVIGCSITLAVKAKIAPKLYVIERFLK